VGRALEALQARGAIRYGVIGLGAGVLSTYARNGDYLRMYEINSLVPQIAQTEFSYVPHVRQLGADAEIVMGGCKAFTREAGAAKFRPAGGGCLLERCHPGAPAHQRELRGVF
jgi:hypothetical protein